MGDRLRILMLEDLPSDAELVAHALRQAGLAFDWKRVDRKPDYLAALEDRPDVVLADYNVPGFGALDALDAALEQGSDVPVIVVTGSLGDEGERVAPDRAGRRLHRVAVLIEQGHPQAVGGETGGDGEPDAAGGAGHERGLLRRGHR